MGAATVLRRDDIEAVSAQRPRLSESVGDEMLGLAAKLLPIPRSLTGDGVRRTLEAIAEWVPLSTVEIPSGSSVYDWVVPPEWNITEAWIADEEGKRIVDFAANSLHVVGYSEPVRARLTGS